MFSYFFLVLNIFYITNKCTVASESLSIFQLGVIPSCNVEYLDISISEKDLNSVKVLVVNDRSYRSYSLTNLTYILLDPNFDTDRKTVIYAHGFITGPLSVSSTKIAKSYLDTKMYNVLMLDSSQLLSFDYISSVTAVRLIGTRLGAELYYLSMWGFDISSLDLVGHSLGAHIMGFTGKSFYRMSGTRLPVIIGLDPAGPCYRAVPPHRRLDKNDAEFVQVVHTNGGLFGLINAIGHVDFYVNGGRIQPKLVYNIITVIFVDHERAVDLWSAVVLYPKKFIGNRCYSIKEIDGGKCLFNNSEKVLMGNACDRNVQGMFFVPTTAAFPFFLVTLNLTEPFYDFEM